jgi:thiol-disulfide isomerase/thioredoxin
MSVVTVGALQSVNSTDDPEIHETEPSYVKHLSGPRDASVAFYGPKCIILLHWSDCGHCKLFLPVYEQTAASNRNVTFYALEVQLAQPQSEMPADDFFKDPGVPRFAVVERGRVLKSIKGNDQQGFLTLLGKFFGVK